MRGDLDYSCRDGGCNECDWLLLGKPLRVCSCLAEDAGYGLAEKTLAVKKRNKYGRQGSCVT